MQKKNTTISDGWTNKASEFEYVNRRKNICIHEQHYLSAAVRMKSFEVKVI